VFALLNLPIPAPPSLQGVAGIVGITAAFLIVRSVR
jgi:XapX domain-containing protein